MTRSHSSPAQRRGPILLVDDYDDARDQVREALENAGYSVIEASNGQQALNYLVSGSEQNITLIILDLQMPVMDGWQLLELLRCYVRLSAIPVIVVTGHDPHLEQMRHQSIFACIQGPYAIKDLIDTVDTCMSRGNGAGSSLAS